MKRYHIDIGLTEEQHTELKMRAKDKGMCKTDYARMKLFQLDPSAQIMTGAKTEDEFITLKEFASKVHISLSSAKKLCRDKRIAYYKIGRSIRIKTDQIEAFYQSQDNSPETTTVYFTTRQAAKYLDASQETVLRWIRKRQLKAYKTGRKYLISRDELNSFILNKRTIETEE